MEMDNPTGMHVKPTDKFFYDSPDSGHPDCKCSRCNKPIPAEQAPILSQRNQVIMGMIPKRKAALNSGIAGSAQRQWGSTLVTLLIMMSMNIEHQVCTLLQAKRLKELGVAQESLCWYVHNVTTELVVAFGYSWTDDPGYECYPIKWSAFTVAELGAMLPKRLKAQWKHADTTGLGGEWQSSCNCSIEYRFDDKKKVYVVSYPLVAISTDFNEANARAGLLIKLLEEKLITAEEANQRLQSA